MPGEKPGGGSPPAFNVPPATLGLALVLIAIHVLFRVFPVESIAQLVYGFAFLPERLAWALEGRLPLLPALWPLVTHMLIHLDLLHLALNVGFLLAFGSPVERRVGAVRFLAILVLSGIVGALFMMIPLFRPLEEVGPNIGASGGIFGLMGVAFAARLGDPQFRLAGGRIVLALFALNLVIGLLSELGLNGGYRIAWMAHAGGFLTGLLIGWRLRRRP